MDFDCLSPTFRFTTNKASRNPVTPMKIHSRSETNFPLYMIYEASSEPASETKQAPTSEGLTNKHK
ncbi:MAG: hypothetical protein A2W93_14025 [Bacteroidetes bacterium GWF2_43_63]|nr:MAG: hypothetical protein A2W94_00595 [Bacteroidetes bacterium GWE2_42_42]OFY52463.1 MAG: hypothetical protein A2W93_14025 [Bacteroidetes bacterium GWF2_43_63]HCB60879.1 hypothetical protein [Bacteroidales bacterium]HCY23946.1 hypothetical protein [Bacteroidales bacterium]